jgi:hypothetical protein
MWRLEGLPRPLRGRVRIRLEMTDTEPQVIAALRAAVAEELELGPSEFEILERRVPGSSEEEPFYLTFRFPRKEGLSAERIDAALDAVQESK